MLRLGGSGYAKAGCQDDGSVKRDQAYIGIRLFREAERGVEIVPDFFSRWELGRRGGGEASLLGMLGG